MTRTYLDPATPSLDTLTTKGDLFVADGAGHASRLGAGADGTALVADSTQTVGLKWQQRSRSISDVHTDASAANTASKTALATIAVPNTVAAGDALRLVLAGDLLNNSGSAVNYSWVFDLGATTMWTLGAFSLSASAARRNWRLEIDLLAAATNDERATGQLLVAGAAGTSVSAHGFGRGTAAEDLSAGKNAVVSITMGTAASTIDCFLHEAVLEIFKR